MLDIVKNIFATIIWTILCAICKQIYAFIKKAETDIEPPKHPHPAKTLHKQFFLSLFTLVIALPVAFSFPFTPQPTLIGVLQVFLLFIAGYALLFVWGAFDAAFAFYPPDNSGENIVAQGVSDHDAQK